MASPFLEAWSLLKGTLTPDGKPTTTKINYKPCPCNGDMNCKQCQGRGYFTPRLPDDEYNRYTV